MGVVEDVTVAPTALLRTPDQILGPFYPMEQEPSLTGDLTRSGRAQGTVRCTWSGRVLTGAGQAGAGRHGRDLAGQCQRVPLCSPER